MPTKKHSEKKKTTIQKTDDLQSRLNSYKKENHQLKQDIKEKNDRLLRSYADIQNLQKRMEKEIECKEQTTKEKYISEIINLHEVLQKAYEDSDPKPGLKLILNNIENLLEKEKITCIECIGKPFDHNYHHAITTIEKNDCEDNIIVEEVKKGYMCGDRLLRPSQVIVAKNKKN